MNSKTTRIDEDIPEDELQNLISSVYNEIKDKIPELEPITARELINYFDGDAPSGDTTTIYDVVSNNFLLIHEIVEISELKKNNLEISANLLYDEVDLVEKAHIIATFYELQIAKAQNQLDWIDRRVGTIEEWKNYPELPDFIKKECQALENEYPHRFIRE